MSAECGSPSCPRPCLPAASPVLPPRPPCPPAAPDGHLAAPAEEACSRAPVPSIPGEGPVTGTCLASGFPPKVTVLPRDWVFDHGRRFRPSLGWEALGDAFSAFTSVYRAPKPPPGPVPSQSTCTHRVRPQPWVTKEKTRPDMAARPRVAWGWGGVGCPAQTS